MKKLHKTGIAIMAALAPAAAAGVTAGVLISMNKGSEPGEDQKVTKAEFGVQYDKLCDVYLNSTAKYTKDDLSNLVLDNVSYEIAEVEYLPNTDNAFKVKATETNETAQACFDLPHIRGDQAGKITWSMLSQYFSDSDNASYVVKADGGIEYTTTDTCTFRGLKVNKFGYIEYQKIFQGSSNPVSEEVVNSITYLHDPK